MSIIERPLYLLLWARIPKKKWSSYHSQQKSPKRSTWMQSQKWQNDLCSFPAQTIQYHSNPSLCRNTSGVRLIGHYIYLTQCSRPCFTNISSSNSKNSSVRWYWVFPGDSVVKNLPANARDVGSTPGSWRFPGEGNGNPLQYSCQDNPMDWKAWRASVHGVMKESNMVSN